MRDVGRLSPTFLVPCVEIDRVESITEHFAATVVPVSSSGASGEDARTLASVSCMAFALLKFQQISPRSTKVELANV